MNCHFINAINCSAYELDNGSKVLFSKDINKTKKFVFGS